MNAVLTRELLKLGSGEYILHDLPSSTIK